MDRREFIGKGAAAVGAALAARVFAQTQPAGQTQPAATLPAGSRPAEVRRLRASDVVTLGKIGLKASRLAIGTGTRSGSVQQKVGRDEMVKLLRHGFDQGVRWWDAADSYQSHGYLSMALKQVKREQVTITSKTTSRDAATVARDVERFRKELDTDYIDIVLLHCLEDPGWREKMKGPMDALSEAKQKGWVRAVGCSCHTLAALRAAGKEPWVEVDLARFNPFAAIMDVPRVEELPQVEQVLAGMHAGGKAVYAMKILGEGRFNSEQMDVSIRFALSKPFISAFSIGFASLQEMDDIIRRIDRLGGA